MDFDEDCNEVENKLACWMSDVSKGVCPFLADKPVVQTSKPLIDRHDNVQVLRVQK